MKRRPTPDTQRSDTHAAALRAPESPVRGILNRVLGAAPAPLACGGLLSFCVGVASSFDIARGLLKQPKPEFLTLQAESKALAAACIARFEAAGQTDADGSADSYKRSHPAWAALVEAGDRKGAATHPAAAALAVELCVSVAQHKRIAGATPSLTELRAHRIKGGFPADIDDALHHVPGLLQAVASGVLNAYFPQTLHADILASVSLDVDGPREVREATPPTAADADAQRRRRDPGFRERVLRAYEYRCCVCGFDLRIGLTPAGLEAAHIQWHHVGGPDIEPNGLSLCSLHHKLFDPGAFTIEPSEHRVVFSQHAISGGRGMAGELQFHGRTIHPPQHADLLPGREFLAWNMKNVFKAPARQTAVPTTRATR